MRNTHLEYQTHVRAEIAQLRPYVGEWDAHQRAWFESREILAYERVRAEINAGDLAEANEELENGRQNREQRERLFKKFQRDGSLVRLSEQRECEVMAKAVQRFEKYKENEEAAMKGKMEDLQNEAWQECEWWSEYIDEKNEAGKHLDMMAERKIELADGIKTQNICYEDVFRLRSDKVKGLEADLRNLQCVL